MKKKNTIVAALAAVTLLGGAGFAYNQAFASNLDEQPTTNYESSSVAEVQITTPTVEEGTPLAETPEGQLGVFGLLFKNKFLFFGQEAVELKMRSFINVFTVINNSSITSRSPA
ncbi:hypothetical protein QP794_24050 [Paenibacillus sp. UMB7766-LJ446]|uniref:hypothetical protein n=1 Tax=Paenibacillus sp. UMB7766-LJ446 TaxID=3046313 RepID=UPI002551B3E3|nr:hypothetical protein [Paenibacillus sp. UMB7766-LJ446]MDK8193165.1 hypothetical protein [Paenibacillus sp. UMB7766-LJ446]